MTENRGVNATKIDVATLIRRGATEPVELIVLSFDNEIYLAEAHLGGQCYGVFQTPSTRLTTRSLAAMKRALELVPHDKAKLRHQSSYDEMIGNPAATQGVLEVPLVIAQ